MDEDPELIKKALAKHRSHYDPTRDTVGKIYRDAQINNREDCIEVGDMARELTTSLVDDINDAIAEYDKREVPYYLMLHESKDLQMKSALRRRMLYFKYRPWPEDDTTVFWKDPKSQDLRFCWCLPHWSEMDNVLQNPHQYDKEYVFQIKMWKKFNLKCFGFYESKEGEWFPNPKWSDKKIEEYGKQKIITL
ncbi:MAG TPA: hypothetical protein VIJ14_08025 [Rhabdochlamydiaceae bacterium]